MDVIWNKEGEYRDFENSVSKKMNYLMLLFINLVVKIGLKNYIKWNKIIR